MAKPSIKFSALLMCLFLLAALCPLPAPVAAASVKDVEPLVITVDSTADLSDFVNNSVCSASTPTGGPCTLRAAIDEANTCTYDACGDDVTILIPAGTYMLSISGADENNNASGDLDLLGWLDSTIPITIQGAGAGVTIIDGNHMDRVFHTIHQYNDIQIRDLTVRGGYREQTGTEWESGGGILHNQGSMRLENVIIEENEVVCSAPSDCHRSRGGGIYTSSTLLINTSTIRGNYAYYGGGIATNSSLEMKVYHSTLSGNLANSAGAFLAYGPSLFYNSTISGNSSISNGAMFNSEGTMKLVNVTLSSNISGSIDANLTISDAAANTWVKNTIIANPINQGGGAATNCFIASGSILSYGYNMSSDNTCNLAIVTGDFPNTDPKLTPLAWLSGATQTHGLLSQSPAHNAKTSGGCTDFVGGNVVIDQRGQNRDAQCDIGAFEGVAYNTYMPVITK